MQSRLPIYCVPIYRVSLFTVHHFVPLNKVSYIKNVLNVSRFTVHPDIPCIFPFPQKHGKSGDDCIAFSKVPRKSYIIICHLFHNVIVRWWRRQCLLPRSHVISLHLRTRKQSRAHCRDKTQTISIVFG